MVVSYYQSQNVSGKSGSKVNGTRLFGAFRQKISVSNGISVSVKVVMFYRTLCSKQNVILDNSFRPSQLFFSKWN